ncbi:MAG: glycosyltransferase [Mediterraneibacter faecis]
MSENTNAAIEAATGEFVVFADHDDELTAHALYECVKVLNEKPETEVLYSDEDKMTMDGHKFFQPHFKPDYNVDLLCTVNYICHLFVAKKTLIDEVGMLRREFDGRRIMTLSSVVWNMRERKRSIIFEDPVSLAMP